MRAVTIRNLDDAVLEALKRRASRHHRNLEAEPREILSEAAFPRHSASGGSRRLKLRLKTVSDGARTAYRRQEIYGANEA